MLPGGLPIEPAPYEHLQHLRELRPGLQLHCCDAREAHDLTAQTEIGPGLRLIVLLEGRIDISYGSKWLQMSAGGDRAHAMLVNVAMTERFTHRAYGGMDSRHIHISLSPAWLEQSEARNCPKIMRGFLRHHLAMTAWQPSARVLALAEQIMRPPLMLPLLEHLYLESRLLDLIAEALAFMDLHATTARAPVPAQDLRLRPHEHQRLRELHAYLCAGHADGWSLAAIARHAGVNSNTLQRQFKAVFGKTVIDFVRQCRMQRARHALEQDGLSVGQAAQIAGFTSAANFATAYRRHFGIQPRLARIRV